MIAYSSSTGIAGLAERMSAAIPAAAGAAALVPGKGEKPGTLVCTPSGPPGRASGAPRASRGGCPARRRSASPGRGSCRARAPWAWRSRTQPRSARPSRTRRRGRSHRRPPGARWRRCPRRCVNATSLSGGAPAPETRRIATSMRGRCRANWIGADSIGMPVARLFVSKVSGVCVASPTSYTSSAKSDVASPWLGPLQDEVHALVGVNVPIVWVVSTPGPGRSPPCPAVRGRRIGDRGEGGAPAVLRVVSGGDEVGHARQPSRDRRPARSHRPGRTARRRSSCRRR